MITLDHPAYTGRVRLRGYNGAVSATGACTPLDASHVLRRLNPAWTKQEHAALGDYHAEQRHLCDQQWSTLVDEAALATWGRPYSIFDYRISGIASDEFPEKFKTRLRFLAHASANHSRLSHAHRAAARWMRTRH